jgi:chromosome segregation ATPase
MQRRLQLVIAVLVAACPVGCQLKPGTASGGAAGATGVAKVKSSEEAGFGIAAKIATRPGPMEISREQLKALDEMTAALEKIKDDATADAVLPDLRKAATRLRAANEQMEALQKEASDADREAARARFNEAEVQEQLQKVIDASARRMQASLQAQINAPGRRKAIQDACAIANVRPPKHK